MPGFDGGVCERCEWSGDVRTADEDESRLVFLGFGVGEFRAEDIGEAELHSGHAAHDEAVVEAERAVEDGAVEKLDGCGEA